MTRASTVQVDYSVDCAPGLSHHLGSPPQLISWLRPWPVPSSWVTATADQLTAPLACPIILGRRHSWSVDCAPGLSHHLGSPPQLISWLRPWPVPSSWVAATADQLTAALACPIILGRRHSWSVDCAPGLSHHLGSPPQLISWLRPWPVPSSWVAATADQLTAALACPIILGRRHSWSVDCAPGLSHHLGSPPQLISWLRPWPVPSSWVADTAEQLTAPLACPIILGRRHSWSVDCAPGLSHHLGSPPQLISWLRPWPVPSSWVAATADQLTAPLSCPIILDRRHSWSVDCAPGLSHHLGSPPQLISWLRPWPVPSSWVAATADQFFPSAFLSVVVLSQPCRELVSFRLCKPVCAIIL